MYNPYDLIEVTVNSHILYGRPIAFDSEPVDMQKMLNKKGEIVKPTKLVTVCPDCGQGIEINIKVDKPPFKVKANCLYCNPTKISINVPQETKTDIATKVQKTQEKPKVEESDLDPLLIKDLDEFENIHGVETLEDQFSGVDLNNILSEEDLEKPKETVKKATKSAKKKVKRKAASKPVKKVAKKKNVKKKPTR